MKGFITLIVAGSIGLLIGYLYFGPGNRITVDGVKEGVKKGIEAVQEKAKPMIPLGLPDAPASLPQSQLPQEESKVRLPQLKNEESKVVFPIQRDVVPTPPEKVEESLGKLTEKREAKEAPPIQDNRANQEKSDWDAKDVDIIFKILNGAQDRLQGKSVDVPQGNQPGAGGTDNISAPRTTDNQTQFQRKYAVIPQTDRIGTDGTDNATVRQAPLKEKDISRPLRGIKGRISYYARKLGLRESLALAMCHVESGFNPNVVSHKGAMGLMQVMPGTANIYGVHKKDLLNPDINIQTGLIYFRDMHSYFRNEEMALAAYNCGPARVLEKKIPMETRIYIRDVKNMERYYARFFA